MNFVRTAWQNFKNARCRAGYHASFRRERIFALRDVTVDSGGDWPQTHTGTEWVPSGRVRMTCRNCGHHYFMFDVGDKPCHGKLWEVDKP